MIFNIQTSEKQVLDKKRTELKFARRVAHFGRVRHAGNWLVMPVP
jgi:hypothetical protein